jgi:hypothetical protein
VTTAIDTSVLLDIVVDDERYGSRSESALARAVAEGAVIAAPVVVAELRAAFDKDDRVLSFLTDMQVKTVPVELGDGLLAGSMHAQYRRAGGQRRRVVADLLIGAHAQNHADRLLARDRGFFQKYFRDLTVWYPE